MASHKRKGTKSGSSLSTWLCFQTREKRKSVDWSLERRHRESGRKLESDSAFGDAGACVRYHQQIRSADDARRPVAATQCLPSRSKGAVAFRSLLLRMATNDYAPVAAGDS